MDSNIKEDRDIKEDRGIMVWRLYIEVIDKGTDKEATLAVGYEVPHGKTITQDLLWENWADLL
jgi:hypothetical protein